MDTSGQMQRIVASAFWLAYTKNHRSAKDAAGFVQNTMEHAEDLRRGPSWGECGKGI